MQTVGNAHIHLTDECDQADIEGAVEMSPKDDLMDVDDSVEDKDQSDDEEYVPNLKEDDEYEWIPHQSSEEEHTNLVSDMEEPSKNLTKVSNQAISMNLLMTHQPYPGVPLCPRRALRKTEFWRVVCHKSDKAHEGDGVNSHCREYLRRYVLQRLIDVRGHR